MVPKIIHYCWFGGNGKPRYIEQYLSGWREKLPGYQIIEWNEERFPISTGPVFVQEAYAEKKYAFVSDYVRLYALYNMGGIYFDTDIEVKQSFDHLLQNSFFIGYENETSLASCVIGSEKGSEIVNYFLSYYEHRRFVNPDKTLNTHTNTGIMTEMLRQQGVQITGKTETVQTQFGTIQLYDREYFSPYDYRNARTYASEKTCAVHHFEQSWLPKKLVYRRKIKLFFVKIFGERILKLAERFR